MRFLFYTHSLVSDWNHGNAHFLRGVMRELVKRGHDARALEPDLMSSSFKGEGARYDVRPYQTTHNTGGSIMSATPETGAVNRYLQAWDQHNVFVMGAGAFVQNIQYNPTGLVGGPRLPVVVFFCRKQCAHERPLVQDGHLQLPLQRAVCLYGKRQQLGNAPGPRKAPPGNRVDDPRCH